MTLGPESTLDRFPCYYSTGTLDGAWSGAWQGAKSGAIDGALGGFSGRFFGSGVGTAARKSLIGSALLGVGKHPSALSLNFLSREEWGTDDSLTAGSAVASKEVRYGHRNIEDLRVGDRVLATNPEISDQERATWEEPDWSTWQLAKLEMTKPDGGILKIDMLRPRDWFDQSSHHAPRDEPRQTESAALPQASQADPPPTFIGTEIWLDLPEMGAEGPARLITLSDCPPIRSGPGQVVTATFSHPPSTTVLDVHFEDEPQPIGVTDNHLFWSVGREEFLPIGDMSIGDRVLTYSGDTKRIDSKLPRPWWPCVSSTALRRRVRSESSVHSPDRPRNAA